MTANRIQHLNNGISNVVDPSNPQDGVTDYIRDPNSVRVETRQGGSARVTHSNGQMSYTETGPQKAVVTMGNPNMVMIDGIETSREVAEAMGLIPSGKQASADANREAPEADLKATSENPNETKGDIEQDPDAFQPEMTAEIQDGVAALAELDSTYGQAQVDGLIKAVATDGELPAELPQYLEQSQIDRVADYYEGIFYQMVSGHDVDMADFSDYLTDKEAMYARQAVVKGDRKFMQRAAEEIARRKTNGWLERHGGNS